MLLREGFRRWFVSGFPVINQDGDADVVDVVVQLQHIIGQAALEPLQVCQGDMDQNGIIDIYDVILLRTTLIGNE